MKPIELLELIKKEKPALLAKLPEKKALALIRTSLVVLGKQLEAADEGVMKVPGMGAFRIKNVEIEKDGKRVTNKRILFRPAKNVAGAAKQDA